MSAPKLSSLTVGDELPACDYPVTRETLVRYAGASGDFNAIHWNERQARAVGLPDVIAHGNLTMALGARYLTTWAQDPTALLEYSVRFARPVVVPDDDTGAVVSVSGKVAEIADDRVRIDLTVTCDDQRVLAQPRAWIRLS